MRRREFIAGLGGVAASPAIWPLAARAQQGERMRRIGVLMGGTESDPEAQTGIATFRQRLQELGWTEGRNLGIEYRWSGTDADRRRTYAAELIALAPDVVVAGQGRGVGALQQASRRVPIVFVAINDPVGTGYVESLARPGGNTTGFSGIEYSQSGKLLELLKQIAPGVARAAVIRDPTATAGNGNLGAIQAAAVSFAMELRPIDSRDAGAIERGLAAFAREPKGGLVVPPSLLAFVHRDLIIKLAARYRLPAVYAGRDFVADGGLVSYGIAGLDPWRGAAGYVDRILRGAKPADLPVQMPTRYETVLNLKTAKALGIDVPTLVLLCADEVID